MVILIRKDQVILFLCKLLGRIIVSSARVFKTKQKAVKSGRLGVGLHCVNF